jgi:hypothetical protein
MGNEALPLTILLGSPASGFVLYLYSKSIKKNESNYYLDKVNSINLMDYLGGYGILDEKLNGIICDKNLIDKIEECTQNNIKISKNSTFNKSGYHLIVSNGKFVYVPVIILDKNDYIIDTYINSNIYNFGINGEELQINSLNA